MQTPKPVMTVLLSRQLDSMTTGNDAYLMVMLRAARQAGMSVRLVFAPTMSFSNRPWLRLHDEYWKAIDFFAWPGSILVKKTFWSYSPRVWGRFALRLAKEALKRAGLDKSKPHSFLADVPWETEARALARASDAGLSAVTVAEYSSLGPILSRLKHAGRRAVLLHDLFAARAEAFRGSGANADHEVITLEQEALRCADADLLIYASLNEAQRFNPLNPGKASVWLRPEVPEHAITADPSLPAHAVFLGTRHGGNRDTVRHLVDDVWPLVRAKRSDAELRIVGSVAADLSPEQAAAPGVKVVGRVENLGSIGGAQAIGLAPTRIASGVSIKVAEYLRLAMPTVVYPLALEGFGPALDDLVAIERSPQAFADRVVALLEDAETRQRMGARGRTEATQRLANTDLVNVLRGVSEPERKLAAE
jgi:glycosyltransferase involved in cell wall biosynthesis